MAPVKDHLAELPNRSPARPEQRNPASRQIRTDQIPRILAVRSQRSSVRVRGTANLRVCPRTVYPSRDPGQQQRKQQNNPNRYHASAEDHLCRTTPQANRKGRTIHRVQKRDPGNNASRGGCPRGRESPGAVGSADQQLLARRPDRLRTGRRVRDRQLLLQREPGDPGAGGDRGDSDPGLQHDGEQRHSRVDAEGVIRR
uniref:(northern house mosquito) hypothetical protein n=1 Tax=Culex pipiens TaxID=7175 RepID=A0A8D8B3U5_CULPI